MAYVIITAEDFEEDVKKITNWLMYKWTIREVNNFQKKLTAAISKVSRNPNIGRRSSKNKDVRSVITTAHNRMYYQIFDDHIALLRLIETKQSPKRNKFD
jgi:plasmid stabilization system protein ParE